VGSGAKRAGRSMADIIEFPHNDLVVQMMHRYNIPMTRENYLQIAYFGELPDSGPRSTKTSCRRRSKTGQRSTFSRLRTFREPLCPHIAAVPFDHPATGSAGRAKLPTRWLGRPSARFASPPEHAPNHTRFARVCAEVDRHPRQRRSAMSGDQHPVIQVLIIRQGCGLRAAKFLEIC
jgi:hypothetical protein